MIFVLAFKLLTIGISLYGPEIMCQYDLFAVINHEGHMDNGHYTNYARFGDEVRQVVLFYDNCLM